MSQEKLVKDPYRILAASAVVGISIYFAVDFVDFIIQGSLARITRKEDVRKMRIKETCEKNCMRLFYKRGYSEINVTVGSGILIKTDRDFSKKSKDSVNLDPNSEKDNEDQEQARKHNALLLTNYHVLHQLIQYTGGYDLRESAKEMLLVEPITGGLFEKDVEVKELIHYDFKCDLALLRVNFADISGIMSGRAPLELAETNPRQQEKVFVTGFPEGVPTVKDPAAVTAVRFRKIDHASGPFKPVEKYQEDKDCFRCLKIDTQVEHGASGGPVMNGEKKIVGVTASEVDQKGGGCLAISVEQIHKFLKEAEESYKKAQYFGQHGIKIQLNEIEVDGQLTAPKYFTVTDYNDHVEIFRKVSVSDPENFNRIYRIDIEPGMRIDGKNVKKFIPSSIGVDSVLKNISEGSEEFKIEDIWYENSEGDNCWFTVNSPYSGPYSLNYAYTDKTTADSHNKENIFESDETKLQKVKEKRDKLRNRLEKHHRKNPENYFKLQYPYIKLVALDNFHNELKRAEKKSKEAMEKMMNSDLSENSSALPQPAPDQDFDEDRTKVFQIFHVLLSCPEFCTKIISCSTANIQPSDFQVKSTENWINHAPLDVYSKKKENNFDKKYVGTSLMSFLRFIRNALAHCLEQFDSFRLQILGTKEMSRVAFCEFFDRRYPELLAFLVWLYACACEDYNEIVQLLGGTNVDQIDEDSKLPKEEKLNLLSEEDLVEFLSEMINFFFGENSVTKEEIQVIIADNLEFNNLGFSRAKPKKEAPEDKKDTTKNRKTKKENKKKGRPQKKDT